MGSQDCAGDGSFAEFGAGRSAGADDVSGGWQSHLTLTIEHTSIIYTEAVSPTGHNSMRGSFIISGIYWAFLIIVLILLIRKSVMKKDFMCKYIKS